jgi:hypothetical protein
VTRLTERQTKRSLECLRLAADCRNLAWSVPTSEAAKRLLQTAEFWEIFADPNTEILGAQGDERSPGR